MYIKMNGDKSLIITIPTTIYRGERNADLITFLVPAEYEGKNIADCAMLMRYINPDNVGKSEALSYKPEMYKGYLQYSTVANTKITSLEGDITVWLTALDTNDDVILKTGEAVITVYPSKDIADYLSSEDMDQLDRLEAQVQALQKQKADNIVFHAEDSTIQLVSEGNEIGDRITISVSSSDTSVCVQDVEINENGELIVLFSDGTTENLGNAVASDGAVYVPHVDEHKVLSWTIENSAGEIPDPVDLNPNDEWSGIDETEVVSDYVWEEL